MKQSEGVFYEVHIWRRVLSPEERYMVRLYTGLAFRSWYARLAYWLKETWLILMGKKDWRKGWPTEEWIK